MGYGNDLRFNSEGYRDRTAEEAMKAVLKKEKVSYQPPNEIGEMIDIFRKIANAYGYSIENRIHFKDGKSGIVYK